MQVDTNDRDGESAIQTETGIKIKENRERQRGQTDMRKGRRDKRVAETTSLQACRAGPVGARG